jgi:hypothetical protein
MVGNLQRGKAPQAYSPVSRIGKIGRFHLHHPIFFYMGQDTAGINAAMSRANCSYLLYFLISGHRIVTSIFKTLMQNTLFFDRWP